MTKLGLLLGLSLCALSVAHAEVFRSHAFHARHHRGHARHHHGWPARTSVSFYYSDYGWNAPVAYAYGGYPVYTSNYVERVNASRTGTGLFWGGLLGAIIGNNSGSLGHNAWRGAAYGAAAGYLLGAVGDGLAREREARTASAEPLSAPVAPAAVESTPAPAPPPPVVRARPATPMSAANALFGRD